MKGGILRKFLPSFVFGFTNSCGSRTDINYVKLRFSRRW